MNEKGWVGAGLACYHLLWQLAKPLLRRNQRIADGFSERMVKSPETLTPADVWLHSASVGESYLAIEILKRLKPDRPVRIITTTQTRQGRDILKQFVTNDFRSTEISVDIRWFPFDDPKIMQKAVAGIRPRLMVLVETELWPGLLTALKKTKTRTLVVNARMNPGNLKKYKWVSSFWEYVSPHMILSITPEDGERFAELFPASIISTISNMKFDRLDVTSPARRIENNSTPSFLNENRPFVVFGSTRKEEEEDVRNMIRSLVSKKPDILIGLFPRHMHRVPHWEKQLKLDGISYSLRSRIGDSSKDLHLILWDTFGELVPAYKEAGAAFIGGSLAPLGGQNFMEALSCGIIPVMGPSWYNFDWIGNEIVQQGLVRMVHDWNTGAAALLEQLENPVSKDLILKRIQMYITKRQGGTRRVCREIERVLST